MKRARLVLLAMYVFFSAWRPVAFAQAKPSQDVVIEVTSGSPAEFQTKLALQALIHKYDLSRYTWTNKVIIQQGAMNHSFPEITLNVRFRDQPDALLSSYVHEQIHWFLREHNDQRVAAIDELQRKYPNAPTAYPEGGGSAESTYGHLITCYLEMQADRQLIGEKRTKKVIAEIPWYFWIWKTVVNDEATIAAVVQENDLEIP
jgi:hypothetical protein